MTMPARNYNSTEIFNVDLKKQELRLKLYYSHSQTVDMYKERLITHQSSLELDMICQERENGVSTV